MNPKDDRTSRPVSASPAPRRRFRLLKLEDRIAPVKGGKGTHKCATAVGCGSASSGFTDPHCAPY